MLRFITGAEVCSPCVITHSPINISSIFSNKSGVTAERELIHCMVMIAIMAAYTFLLIKTLPKPKRVNTKARQ